jgi:hypothetical protein
VTDRRNTPETGLADAYVGILSGYPALPKEIANRLGGSK